MVQTSLFDAQNSRRIVSVPIGSRRLRSLSRRRCNGFIENTMFRMLLLTLPLLIILGTALAEMGGGKDRDRVSQQVEAVRQDGRWERTVAEGRANRHAFKALRQAQAQISQPATGYPASDVAGRRARN